MSGGRPGAHAGRGAHPGFLPCPAASGQPGRPRHASGSQVRRHPDIRLLSDIARARGRRARPARHRHRQEPPALPGAFNRTAIASVARTRHKRALTCRPGRDQTCDLDYKAPDGSAGNEISEPFGLRRSVTASLRVGSFSGKGSQTGTSGTRAATCAWPPPRIDAYSSLIPATRRESSRTYRKYEVPNHVVTQNDWQPPRRVENPRPKSGRSPVRSRPWPPGFTHPQRNRAPTDCRPCSSHRLSNRRILSRCLTAGSTSTAISKRRNPIRYKLRGLRQFPNWSKRGQPRRIGKETCTPPVRVDRSR